MGSCANSPKNKQIDKYKRKVHFANRVVVKVHKVKRDAADSRSCVWYVPRTLEIQKQIDRECDALIDENKIHFRKIKESIERQSKQRMVIDAIQDSMSETTASTESRNKLLDTLDGVSLAALALQKWNTAAEKMLKKEEYEKKNESISSHFDKRGSSSQADGQAQDTSYTLKANKLPPISNRKLPPLTNVL